MYKTALLMKSSKMTAWITAMDIRGGPAGFEIGSVCTDMDTVLNVVKIFEQKEWLDLYLNEKDFFDDIIRYILFHPESDLRQKTLSEERHINQSYFSTVFTAQTGQRFVDYITYVKLMRAAWLLKNTKMKISEIAGRIDYKDIAYFSKQFKKTFHITPSEYRIPDDYFFQI